MSNTIIINNEGLRAWLENFECFGTWDDDDNAFFENESDFNKSFALHIAFHDNHTTRMI